MYFKLITPVAIAFLFFVLAARALGTVQSPNPALRGFSLGCEDQSQPCWYGIMLGTTTLEEAQTILNQTGFERDIDDVTFRDSAAACTIRLLHSGAGWESDDFIVNGIQLYACSNLHLGDFLATIAPIMNVNYANPFYVDGVYRRGAYVTLENGIVITAVYAGIFDSWFSLYSPVIAFTWRDATLPIGYPWYGFITRAAYCQRMPQSDICL